MEENSPLINRVANSGLITINLEDFFPKQEIVSFDIKQFLYMEMILKEKDFRAALKEWDWTSFQDKILCVQCSVDAIIPTWAYMLISANASPFAADIYFGQKDGFIQQHYDMILAQMDFEQYSEKRIVIKGCSDAAVPPSAYMKLTAFLRPFAQSIMFGEPCSTVPIFKRPRVIKK